MKLFEFEAKNILRSFGIAVPQGFVVKDGEGLRASYNKLGGEVTLKSQIPVGGRMKARIQSW